MTCAPYYPTCAVVGSPAKRINGKYWRKRLLPGARFAEVARRYGIAERVLFRWKQELTVTAPAFCRDRGYRDRPPPAGLVRSNAD
jgi:hypothetical protein